MRRKDREMDSTFALEVFDKAPYITVSFTRDDGKPYALPLSLARTDEGTFYFHCASEGEKLRYLEANPSVCLSAVSYSRPVIGPKDNSFTLEYKSAVAFGKGEIVEEKGEKIEALRAICNRFLPSHMDAFDQAIEQSLHMTTVVRITLTSPPTGKRKKYNKQGNELKYGEQEND